MSIKILVFIVLAFSVGLTAALLAFVENQHFDKAGLINQQKSLRSYTAETIVLLDQDIEDKVSFTYTKGQAQHINEKVDDFYNELQSDLVQDAMIPHIKKTEKLVFALSLNLKQIQSSNGEKTKLQRIKSDVIKINYQLKSS
jgi:hypothetical protein